MTAVYNTAVSAAMEEAGRPLCSSTEPVHLVMVDGYNQLHYSPQNTAVWASNTKGMNNRTVKTTKDMLMHTTQEVTLMESPIIPQKLTQIFLLGIFILHLQDKVNKWEI